MGGLIRALDVFLVAWVVAWAFAGIAIGRQIQGLALDGAPAYGTIDGIYGLDALPIRWD